MADPQRMASTPIDGAPATLASEGVEVQVRTTCQLGTTLGHEGVRCTRQVRIPQVGIRHVDIQHVDIRHVDIQHVDIQHVHPEGGGSP